MKKDIVIKKKNKYYNTLTEKYVTKAYAKRLNSYFKKHPEKTLYQAGGHGKYRLSKPLVEHGKDIKRLAYGKKSQIIRTVTRHKKKTYFAPINVKVRQSIKERYELELIEKIDLRKLKNLDYWICNKKVFVELYRLTRDLNSIYHILTWKIGNSFSHSQMVEFWEIQTKDTYDKIMMEIKKLVRLHRFSNLTFFYAHINTYFYSKLDGWEKGKAFGFVIPNKSGYEFFNDRYKEILNFYKNKLDNDAYHKIAILMISFYLYDSVRNASKTSVEIASYRIGVNRLFHVKK